MQRREFITIWIRYLLLALLGAISIIALVNRKEAENNSCIPGNLCSSCNKYKGCKIPQKESVRS
jgi:hypothetical protein